VRIYNTLGMYQTHWNRFRPFGPVPGGRLDHHLLPPRKQARKILYCAFNAVTSLAEVFQDTRVIDPNRLAPRLARFKLVSSLMLLDLTDEAWSTEVGAPSNLYAGARPTAQEWSRAIFEVYPEIHGIFYPSVRHRGGRSVALYERAIPALPTAPDDDIALAEPELRIALENAAEEIGYDIVPTRDPATFP